MLSIEFQESVLSECEVTSIELVPPLLFAGTTSGAIVMWNLETLKIVLRLKRLTLTCTVMTFILEKMT